MKLNISAALIFSHLPVLEKTCLWKANFWVFFLVTSTLPTMEKVAQFCRSLTLHRNTYHVHVCITDTYTHIFMYCRYMYTGIYVWHITPPWGRLGTLWWEHSSAKKALGSSGQTAEHKIQAAQWANCDRAPSWETEGGNHPQLQSALIKPRLEQCPRFWSLE